MADAPKTLTIENTLADIEDWTELVSSDQDRAALKLVAATIEWMRGNADAPDLPQPEWCQACEGTGGWSTPIEDAHGRSLDLDHECPRCGGSRVEP